MASEECLDIDTSGKHNDGVLTNSATKIIVVRSMGSQLLPPYRRMETAIISILIARH